MTQCPSHLVPFDPERIYEQEFRDWLETDTIINSVSELSPVISLSDLPDVIPEHDEYRAMPHSLRQVLAPPTPNASTHPRSILLEPTFFNTHPSPYSRPRWSPCSESSPGGVSRARQSVSSIGSCSTVQTRSPAPIKSILTRHDSGISMATTTKSIRRKRRSPPSVKFVDTPTVHYDDAVYGNVAPPRSSPSPSQSRKPPRWFAKWWKKPCSPPPRPSISGPYHLSHTASLVDVYTSRLPKPQPSRLRQLWHRLTSAIG